MIEIRKHDIFFRASAWPPLATQWLALPVLITFASHVDIDSVARLAQVLPILAFHSKLEAQSWLRLLSERDGGA